MIRRSSIPALVFLILFMSFPLLIGLFLEGFGEGVVLLFFGIPITALAVLAAMRGFSRRKWPTTTGAITESEYKFGRGLFGWRDSEHDNLIVHYSYTVEDQTFNDSLELHPTSDTCSKVFGGHPKKDAAVRVYYNPRKPAESVLEPGPGCLTLVFFVLGLAGTGLGCYLIWS